MPRASASSSATPSTWAGAPPVVENGFSFANGEFFADSSSQNRHRRATLGELKEHFDTGTDKDHPAHWFEAQLIHYGLQPSKTKSVARMRLFDAVKANNLAVPSTVVKLEAKLKKEWTKQDREAKKAHKEAAASQSKSKPKATPATKRKAADDTPTSSTVKKPKTTAAKPKPKPKPKETSASAPKKTPATKTPTKAKAPAKPKSTPKPKNEPEAPKPQTARARRGGISQGPSRQTPTATSSSSGRFPRIQTARRSGAFMARGRIPAPSEPMPSYDGYDSYNDDDDDDHNGGYSDSPPPPYSYYDQEEDSDADTDTYPDDLELAPLGLINGHYGLSSNCVTSQWSHVGSNFDLVLTLSGSSVWGSFDLGIVEGVMYFEDRPWQSSNDPVPFKWRGREIDGPIIYGNHNSGHITFLGDGRIEGQLDYMRITFRGRRSPGQGTRSDASASSLQVQWNGYSEEQYEQERVSRWH